MLRIERTARADRDLQAIWQYIAEDSETAADRVVRAIVLRWQQLAANPYSGPSRDDIFPGIRHLVVGSYLTFYRLHPDRIEIVRILHGSRRAGPESFD